MRIIVITYVIVQLHIIARGPNTSFEEVGMSPESKHHVYMDVDVCGAYKSQTQYSGCVTRE